MSTILDLQSHGIYLNLSARELSIKRDIMIKHGLPFKDNTRILAPAAVALSAIAGVFIKLAFDLNFSTCVLAGSVVIASLLYVTKQPDIPPGLKKRISGEETLIKQIDAYKLNWAKAVVLNSIDPFNFDNPQPLLTLDELDHFVFGDTDISYPEFIVTCPHPDWDKLTPKRRNWLRESFGNRVKKQSLGWNDIRVKYANELKALKMAVKDIWPFIKENELKLTFATLVSRNGHGIRWYFTPEDRAIMGPKFLNEFFNEVNSFKTKPPFEVLRVLAQEAADLDVWEAFIAGLKERKLIESSSSLVCLRTTLLG